MEDAISQILRDFWQQVFGWDGAGLRPTLEDHFTQIDLAANTGHWLGPYNPKKLRAIRRMSIDRVFKLLLNRKHPESAAADRLFTVLRDRFELSVVTSNWDVGAEQMLRGKRTPS